MSWQLALILACICVGVLVLILAQMEKPRRSLRHYRPTHDNRFVNRDEFRGFMKDCK